MNTSDKIVEIKDDSYMINNNKIDKKKNKDKDYNKINDKINIDDNNNSESSKEEINNFNQTLFNYKEYKPIKRKYTEKEISLNKKIRKNTGNNNWIKKDSKERIKNDKNNIIELLSNSSKSSSDHFSSIEEEFKNIPKNDKKILHIINEDNETSKKKEKENKKEIEIKKIPTPSSESSISSLEFNSRVQSKNKQNNFNNNFQINPTKINNPLTKYQEFLMFKNPNTNQIIENEKEKINSKIQQRNFLINDINNQMDNLSKEESIKINNTKESNQNNYKLNIQTQEPTYDEFYKLKHNDKINRRSFPSNKNIKIKKNNNISLIENTRNRKEREKMQGHKCEQCQKFYDIMGDNGDKFCEECSRHRTNNNINTTPKSFYDLSF